MYRPVFIYCLVGVADGRLGYWGQAKNVRNRTRGELSHARRCENRKHHLCNWLKSIDFDIVVEIDSVWLRQEDADVREDYLIQWNWDENTNMIPGGWPFNSASGSAAGKLGGALGGTVSRATFAQYSAAGKIGGLTAGEVRRALWSDGGTPEMREEMRRIGQLGLDAGAAAKGASPGGSAMQTLWRGSPEQHAWSVRGGKAGGLLGGATNAQRWADDPDLHPMKNPTHVVAMVEKNRALRRCLASSCTFVGNHWAMSNHTRREPSHKEYGWELV